MMNSGRPAASEHSPSLQQYIDLAPEEDVVSALEAQGRETSALLSLVDDETAASRYAPGKWSVTEVVGHIADAERVFAYRAMCIARGETRSLPSFEEESYAAKSGYDARPLSEVVEELAAVRRASVLLFKGLPDGAWQRIGTANEKPVSVRALAYVMLGHERHHLNVLRERYRIG